VQGLRQGPAAEMERWTNVMKLFVAAQAWCTSSIRAKGGIGSTGSLKIPSLTRAARAMGPRSDIKLDNVGLVDSMAVHNPTRQCT